MSSGLLEKVVFGDAVLENVEEKLVAVVSGWRTEAVVAKIEPLTPDASARRYFRITFKTPLEPAAMEESRPGRANIQLQGIKTAVAMVFLSTAAAESGGGNPIPSDQSYVELTALFRQVGIPVPQLYLDRRERSILLIEDCGDQLLGNLLVQPAAGPSAAVPNEKILAGYYTAVSELVRLRRVSPAPGHFLRQRRFTAELFYKEVCEFRDFFLTPQLEKNQAGLTEIEHSSVERTLKLVSQAAAALPTTTVHRDYHSWNLLLQDGDTPRIRIIDFQDALQGPLHYDLVGLVNDRDTDSLLGAENYRRIIDWYREAADVDGAFDDQFRLASIQRDLKVAGRFGKLTKLGVGSYDRWIPGTLRRLRRQLDHPFSAECAGVKIVGSELKQLFGELAAILDNRAAEIIRPL